MSTSYTYYNPLSGRVLASGFGSDYADHNPGDCELLLGVMADITQDYVDPLTGEVRRRPPRPSLSHTWDWGAHTWVMDTSRSWWLARAKRTELLADCDWTQLPDVPERLRSAWATYRQALRDITKQPDPTLLVWPTPPIS